MRSLIAALSFSVFSFAAFSQDDQYEMDENIYEDIIPKHSLTMELGLPIPCGNKAFQSMMSGIIKTAPYYHFTLKNHLSFGIGADYSYIKTDPFKTPEKIYGGIHSLGGFFRVGYEQFHSMRFGTDFGVKLGYTNILFDTDMNRQKGGSQSLNCVYVEPTAAVVLTAGEFTSYRFVVGYSFQTYSFSPMQLGSDSMGGYHLENLDHPSQFLTVGFGFSYYFRQWN